MRITSYDANYVRLLSFGSTGYSEVWKRQIGERIFIDVLWSCPEKIFSDEKNAPAHRRERVVVVVVVVVGNCRVAVQRPSKRQPSTTCYCYYYCFYCSGVWKRARERFMAETFTAFSPTNGATGTCSTERAAKNPFRQ